MKRKLTIKGFIIHDSVASELHSLDVEEFVDVDIHCSDSALIEWKKKKPIVDLLILEVDASQEDNVDMLASEMERIDKSIATLILLNNGDTLQVRKLMRAGVRDVFLMPDDVVELRQEVLSILHSKQQEMQSDSNQVVCFFNAKGGAGATTLAISTAYALAEKFSNKVCVVDFDLQLGDVAYYLDVENKKNIKQALNQPERIDATLIKSLVTPYSKSLDVLASPGDLTDLQGISPDSVAAIINAVAEVYDIVIIDIPSYFSPWVLEAIKRADRNFLVVQRSMSILRGATLIMKKLKDVGVDSSRFEIINNRDSKKTGVVNHKQMLDTLRKDEMFNIHNDYSLISESQESGKPISKLAFASSVNKDVEVLARAIYENKTAQSYQGFIKRHFGG